MITYEDEESLQTKLDYVIQHDLGGMMFWELSGDDAQHALVKQMGSALIDGSP
jgi:GH18 family chitinase